MLNFVTNALASVEVPKSPNFAGALRMCHPELFKEFQGVALPQQVAEPFSIQNCAPPIVQTSFGVPCAKLVSQEDYSIVSNYSVAAL